MINLKFVILVLFLASMKIVNNNCDEIYQHKEMQKKFLQTVNRIPTLEHNFYQVPESDIIVLLHLVEHGINWGKPESYLRKLWSFSCTYGHVTLYVLYHLIEMQCEGQCINEPFVHNYREYMHHMLQLLYLADGYAYQEMWYVAVILDAVVRDELVWGDINFRRIAHSLIDNLKQKCTEDYFLFNFQVFEQLEEHFDFGFYIDQLVSYLMLSEGQQLFMSDLYVGDDQFEIYRFIWDDREYTNFAPPNNWFPSYDGMRLRTVYEEVAQRWKSDFHALKRYTDSIRNLLMTVTYYALLLHCQFMQTMWYIVFHRVHLVDSSSEQMQNDCIALLQLPLPLVEIIFENLHILEDMEYLNDIKDNLTYHENADRTAFMQFVNRLLNRYNFYARQFDLEQMDNSAMQNKFAVPNETNTVTLKATLLEFTGILNGYYETVMKTLSPTNFRVIEYSTSNNPLCVNMENEHEQDLETYIYFLKIMNEIPTLDPTPQLITPLELSALITDANNHISSKARVPDSFQRKINALHCAYGHAALSMFYHIHDLYKKDHLDEMKFYLGRYVKCAHRIMSVMYASKGPIFRALWTATIALDIIRHGEICEAYLMLKKIVNTMVGPMKICHKKKLSNKLFRSFNELVSNGPYDFAAYNDHLLSWLMLSDGNEGVMMELYRGEERFDIYHIFWDKSRDYKNFAPPATWFPLYDDYYLRKVYDDVVLSWKKNFYIITLYKDAVINLVLMVTFYDLLLHFHYLETTWSIVTGQVESDDFAASVRIPLPLIKVIFRDLDILEEHTNLINEIEDNLANSDITGRKAFKTFVNRMLEQYNFYTRQFGLKQLDYSTMKKEFSVSDQMELSDLKIKLFEFAEILNGYYKTVKWTLSPTNFRIIKYFTSSKPACISFVKPKDPNDRKSAVTYKHNKPMFHWYNYL